MRLRPTIRRIFRDLRQSAARFEHRGVVVTYRGLVIDQTAIVQAIDAAVGGIKEDVSPWLPMLRVSVHRSQVPGEDIGASMMAVWTGGLLERGVCRVLAGEGCAEAIRAGVHALLMSKVDKAWKAAPLGDRVF